MTAGGNKFIINNRQNAQAMMVKNTVLFLAVVLAVGTIVTIQQNATNQTSGNYSAQAKSSWYNYADRYENIIEQNQANVARMLGDYNDVAQSNAASATGSGNIEQNQANVADIYGDYNDVAQSNAANAEGDGDITQNQANVADIDGDDNDVSQSNSANAEGDGDITQNQANVAQIDGDDNSVSQSNSANAGGEDDE